MTRGLFIAIEGCDGAGKTTQCLLVRRKLEDDGYQVAVTREPGATPLGLGIRRLLLDPARKGMAFRAEALLYAADRAQHASVIVPLLESGIIVITDRYMDSTLAYQGYGRGEDVEELRGLSLWASDGLVPDVTFLLDIDPTEGAHRRKGSPDRIESEGEEFHQAVRNGFLDLAAADPGGHFIIAATMSPQNITDLIVARVASLLPVPVQDRELPGRWQCKPHHGGSRDTMSGLGPWRPDEGLKHLAHDFFWEEEKPSPPEAPPGSPIG